MSVFLVLISFYTYIWENKNLIMYSYHNRIKQRINNNELDRFEYIEEHKGDTNYGMMLHFNTEPYTRPIKNHKVKDYEEILGL